MSKQKELIYSLVSGVMTHPTADWIYQEARRKMPNISLGTVYRNLKALAEEGRILEIITTKGPSRYDANTSRHSHLRCENCGKMEDVPHNKFQFPKKGKIFRGFQVFEYRIEFIGLCSNCKKHHQDLH